MHSISIPACHFDDLYPERVELGNEEWLDRMGVSLTGKISRWIRSRPAKIHSIVASVAAVEIEFERLGDAAIQEKARELKRHLRSVGMREDLVAQVFALVREVSNRKLGMRHFDVQLVGGWIMLNGMIAEMETGEGKTLTATLAACTAALAGLPVHVITVNDYLVERDYALMRIVYESMGLTVAAVTAKMDHRSRQAAYACDVVYCSNKTIVFDYLRDRILLGSNSDSLHLRLEKIYGKDTRSRRLLLRGLNFAIVDEADSVLVDEARTPLIISSEAHSEEEALVARQALDISSTLGPDRDFEVLRTQHRVMLTPTGRQHILALCKEMGGVWAGTIRREELVSQALAAQYLFKRDEHYIVRDGKVLIIDEFTGRVMSDRSWGQGLQQLIETKEGCKMTSRKEPLARISYQRFFRRYRHLSGMTGTGAEVSGELGTVYELAVVKVPTHRPSRRVYHQTRIFQTAEEKWQCIADRIAELHGKGIPVLLGTRSVLDSETASRYLAARGIEHRVLNAKQDQEEADIVAMAGRIGQITIATNMAGRGTDIKLMPGVEDLGGLHVILSERHEAGRIDRQLAGRCARQGDPGSFEMILSMEDNVLQPYFRGGVKWVSSRFAMGESEKSLRLRERIIRFAQYRTERFQSKIRKRLLKADRQMDNILSFSGRPE